MKREKLEIVETFLEVCDRYEMKLYRSTIDNQGDNIWTKVENLEILKILAPSYSWANIWEIKNYVDYESRNKNGITVGIIFDTPVKENLQLEWEIHLTLGNEHPENSTDSSWFVACNKKERPSI